MSLVQSRFGLAEFKRSTWHALIPSGTEPEALADPAYWAHNAASVKAFDLIEARDEGGQFWLQLLVVKAEKQALYTTPLKLVDLRAKVVPIKDEAPKPVYEAKFRGPRKWSVLRSADGALVAEGLQTQADADAEIERLLALKAAA